MADGLHLNNLLNLAVNFQLILAKTEKKVYNRSRIKILKGG